MSPYHRPCTLVDALGLLAEAGDGITVAAGCTDLFPATDRPALQGPVLDITGVDALRGIDRTGYGVRIGAATRWTDIIQADLPPAFDMLKLAGAEVGSVQIQNAGTLGGNLCNASPAADGVPCLLALEAEVELASVRGNRRLLLADFLTGPRQTALAGDELLVAVHIPDHAQGGRSAFLKLGARRYLVISIAMVAVRLVVKDKQVAEAAIAVGACSAVARRLKALETALAGQAANAGLSELVTPARVTNALSPIDDIRADAVYRNDAAVVMLRRALLNLTNPAQGGVAA